MRLAHNPLMLTAVGINLICMAYVATMHLGQSKTSKNLLVNRQSALNTIAKHIKSDSCWELQSKKPLSLGETVELPIRGKIPTSCLKSPKTKQWIAVEYLNGQLQISQVFSDKEIKAAKSQIDAQEKENRKK